MNLGWLGGRWEARCCRLRERSKAAAASEWLGSGWWERREVRDERMAMDRAGWAAGV